MKLTSDPIKTPLAQTGKGKAMSGLGAWKESFGAIARRPGGRVLRNTHWLAGAALGALAIPAQAQDPAQEAPAQAEEAGDGFGEEIVVTAERRATNLQDTPLSVVAITSEIAEAKGIEDLEDLAKFT